MKIFCKFIALLLTVIMLLTVGPVTLATDITVPSSLPLSGMSNASVSQAVMHYFTQRSDYLMGNTAAMDWLVIGIANDEEKHLMRYKANSIVLDESTHIIIDMECYDTYAKITTLETVAYTQNGISATEEVFHQLTVYLDNSNVPIVAADEYIELCTNFESCSYVKPTTRSSSGDNTGGSSLCIIEVAKAEVGTTETETNITKYGAWYGWNGVAWCAIFVSWCANEANINTSVIKKTASCDEMMNDFITQNKFYYSQNFGGSYTPQPGDILFVGTEINDSTHVGIVEKVENNRVWIYDGNYSDKVSYHYYALTASNVIGYGHPEYPTTGHTCYYLMDEMTHCIACENCCFKGDTAAHSFSTTYSTNNTHHWHACTTCEYQNDIEEHTTNSGYSSDPSGHWKTCDTCNVVYAYATHFMLTQPTGKERCKFCGYTTGFAGGGMQSVGEHRENLQ